jgi:pantoate--beta-alanine ligase
MKVFKNVGALQEFLSKPFAKSVGFVPTMGALHEGHLSLIQKALSENDAVICSIFVNPIQFNNSDDLKNYPRVLEEDKALLEKSGCDVLFVPEISEIYPEGNPGLPDGYKTGELGTVMEGKFRPGHFDGVVTVVKRLFDIVNPTRAYFGLKDYQQQAIIKNMVCELRLPVEIVSCEIKRDFDGLALSSRNRNLSPELRKAASAIPRVLEEVKEKKNSVSVQELKKMVEKTINNTPGLKFEYFEISNSETLSPLENVINGQSVACIAVFAGNVRLIDNILL